MTVVVLAALATGLGALGLGGGSGAALGRGATLGLAGVEVGLGALPMGVNLERNLALAACTGP